MRAFKGVLKTELKISFRGIDMFIFAICLPVALTVVLGLIYGNEPAYDGAKYSFLAQSFGALSTIAVCAGGVMGLPLVISDYRQKKILKRFKVTPVSPGVILAAQLVIYAIYSLASLVLVFITAAVFFNYRMDGSWLSFIGSYLLVMMSMFSIGMMVGGVAKNSKTAGVGASLLYFPMLIFSGATLPYEVMPKVLQDAAGVLPLTQGIKLLKAASLGQSVDGVVFPIILMFVITVICIAISIRLFKWE